MNTKKLRIGRIPYANLFPIFWALQNECDCSLYEFVDGVPSELNRMLKEGTVDVSPSSSIEYLRNHSLYGIIEEHSISSQGPVGSIFLFTKEPLEKLNGATVYVTSQSETSVGLLSIILRKFYGVHSALRVSAAPEGCGDNPFLLIGDDALRYKKEVSGLESRKEGLSYGVRGGMHVYDLGDLWYRKTGLPFVFALWIVQKELFTTATERTGRGELLRVFIHDLNKAKGSALRNLRKIARHSPLRESLSEDEIIAYWDNLDYELTTEHKRGLALFDRYLKELHYF